MRLSFPTQADAQAFADRIYQQMQDRDPAYKRSVRAGQTTAWAKPYQDLDKDGVPLNSTWWVNAKERCRTALTDPERTALQSYRI